MPLLKNPKTPWRKSFLTEYFQEKAFPRVPTWRALRDERWKYIQYEGLTGMDELYDVRSDPHELKNVINEPKAQSALKKMKTEMERAGK